MDPVWISHRGAFCVFLEQPPSQQVKHCTLPSAACCPDEWRRAPRKGVNPNMYSYLFFALLGFIGIFEDPMYTAKHRSQSLVAAASG